MIHIDHGDHVAVLVIVENESDFVEEELDVEARDVFVLRVVDGNLIKIGGERPPLQFTKKDLPCPLR